MYVTRVRRKGPYAKAYRYPRTVKQLGAGRGIFPHGHGFLGLLCSDLGAALAAEKLRHSSAESLVLLVVSAECQDFRWRQ